MAEAKGREVTFYVDPLNERVVLAGELRSADYRRDFVRKIPADAMLTPEHAAVQAAIIESENRKLEPTPSLLARLSNGAVDVRYVEELIAGYPDVPAEPTFKHAVDELLWDRHKHVVATGPISSLIEVMGKGDPPERVRAVARQVAQSFDGWGDRRHLHDARELVRSQVADLRERMMGRAVYPYGIPGLDYYDPQAAKDRGEKPEMRMLPGAKPGEVTVVTGLSGSGKSTTVARIVLGLIRQKRKVLYGAWEMSGGVTIELLAILSLGWSRSKMTKGLFGNEELREIETRMLAISEYVTFLKNPFRLGIGGGKPSNERNLDLVAGYVADSGCQVAVFDLWKRCLVSDDPADEEQALYRQQAIGEELGVHSILVQQQRLKDVEQRPDKRPTREGIKGSGAWVEVGDTIIGVHNPAKWKPVPEDTLELDVLKQRYGKWPLAIEFDWDPDCGKITGGTSVEYDIVGGRGASSNPIDDAMREPKKGARR